MTDISGVLKKGGGICGIRIKIWVGYNIHLFNLALYFNISVHVGGIFICKHFKKFIISIIVDVLIFK